MPAEPISSWSKAKWLRFVLVIVAAVAVSQVVAHWLEERDREKFVVDAIAQAAATIQSKAPFDLDELTALTGASGQKDELLIKYTIKTDVPAEKRAAIEDALRLAAKENLCANGGMKTILAKGGKIVLAYSDKSNASVAELRFDGTSCS